MSVLNTWTIPSDPGFQTRRSDRALVRESDYNRVRARVKPEAMSIALKSQGSVAQLFNPYAKPHSFETSRSGTHEVKRDFVKENAKQIRKIQKLNQESARESSREPLKVIHKPDKFEHVESKVARELKGNPTAPRSTVSSFLRKHSQHEYPVSDRPSLAKGVTVSNRRSSAKGVTISDRPSSAKGVTISDRPSSAKANTPSEEKEKSKAVKTNHISKNILHASSSPVLRRRPPSAVAVQELEKKRSEEEKKYKRGHVPNYLRKRQEQWRIDEEERIRNIPDPSIPPGHTLMPRDERLQTLELLKKKHKDMTTELNSLPVSCDTLRIKTRKTELEKKLRDIENAIKIFSRPKVFVKADA